MQPLQRNAVVAIVDAPMRNSIVPIPQGIGISSVVSHGCIENCR